MLTTTNRATCSSSTEFLPLRGVIIVQDGSFLKRHAGSNHPENLLRISGQSVWVIGNFLASLLDGFGLYLCLKVLIARMHMW